MLQRAYGIFTVKAIDAEQRVIIGTASTPTPDRMGDVVEPFGATFKNPSPLLLYHDSRRPVGSVKFSKPTADGIEFEASIPNIPDPGPLRDRVQEAWDSVRAGLIRGVSIGFRALEDGVELMKNGGLRFKSYELLELSLVAIPANAEATIAAIKSFDAAHLAATGNGHGTSSKTHTPGATGTPVVKALPSRLERQMKSLQDQITSFKSTRDAKWTEMNEIMTKAGEAGETLDAEKEQQYDTLKAEVESIDKHLKRLEEMERFQKAEAKPVAGSNPHEAHVSRGETTVIQVRQNLPPGIEFARAVICKTAAFLSHGSTTAMEVAKTRYPDNPRVQNYLKATVAGGTTTDSTWAGPLVDQTNLAGEFIEFLRPQTLIGKFGVGNVPSLRRVPFNIRVVGQTSGGTGYWVGQGAPKPLTKFDFEATTLLWAKAASIAVISEELARFSTPSAEMLVRDALAASIIERLDIDFIHPSVSAVANVSPASITNGITPLATAGTSADNARTDLATLFKTFIDANLNPAGAVLIMPNSLAMSLSLLVNSLGQPEFPGINMNGGTLQGLPVITSQYAAYPSAGFGNIVVLVKADEIFLADDGQVTVDASREASLQMLDNPTNNIDGTATSMVSMFQTNSIALRAERFINWARRRTQAVSWMDDVNWGSVGSPVG